MKSSTPRLGMSSAVPVDSIAHVQEAATSVEQPTTSPPVVKHKSSPPTTVTESETIHASKSMQKRGQDRSALCLGPINGALPSGTRDNRDMSEGLEKSRSQKLGAFAPIQIEAQS